MKTASPTVDAVQLKTKVGRETVQRIKEGQTSVGTDKLLAIAEAFDVASWQLLQPDLKPRDLTSSAELAAPNATVPVVSWVQDGDTLFVDPERQADHRSLVIVRLNDEKELTFKQLLIKGGQRMLQALNRNWPNRTIPINGNCSICGVVIGKVESFN